MSETILPFKLLTAQPELFSIALSFQAFGLLKLALVKLSKLCLDLLLILFSLALEASFLFFKGLLSCSFFSFVLKTVGFI